MFLRKLSNGEWYICRRTTGGNKSGKVGKHICWRDRWLIKCHGNGSEGSLIRGDVCFPKEFIGKKIRLKVEIIDDKDIGGLK